MEFIKDNIENYLISLGFSGTLSITLTSIILILLLILLIMVVKLIVDKIILIVISNYIEKNHINWAKFFIKRKVFNRLSHLIPAIIIILFISLFPNFHNLILRINYIYIVLIGIFVIYSVLDALEDIYNTKKFSRDKPIKSFNQVIKITFTIAGGIIIIASLIGESPIIILSGLGAITAILLIVFKDSLLGLVAGIQITANDMLRIGDWIEMPKYDADGDVIEINLNTVKVQNWDRTITTIPAYALISDSFKNWRGMQQSGGRRIKRSIHIDVESVDFLKPQILEKLKKVDVFKDFINQKENEIENFNKNNNVDTSILINGRRLTNLGTFRAYILHYLKNNDKIHKEMILMVRQLAPTQQGIPLEVYAFTNDINWINYENIQSDIFDHLFAVTKEFGLRVYQNPTGNDIKIGLSKNQN